MNKAVPFAVGDIVRYSPKYCGPGEEKYIHRVMEVNDVTGLILIMTINTPLVLGYSERVYPDMIEKI